MHFSIYNGKDILETFSNFTTNPLDIYAPNVIRQVHLSWLISTSIQIFKIYRYGMQLQSVVGSQF